MNGYTKHYVYLHVSLYILYSPNDGNQLVCVHVSNGSDVVMSLRHPKGEDLVGELVAVLSHQFTKVLHKDLPIMVANNMTVSAKGKVRVRAHSNQHSLINSHTFICTGTVHDLKTSS